MTRIFVTIDTELSAAHFEREGLAGMERNFASSIRGASPGGDVGIFHQMDVLERHGLKGVFFVDPMPALVYGAEVIARIVRPIVARGHDVQLHVHSEWLAFAKQSPVPGRTGHNMHEFPFADQVAILNCARQLLIDAGANAPVAFRAGNYGANDDTLAALARVGLRYDSSFTPPCQWSHCRIALPVGTYAPLHHRGVIEVPTGTIADWNGQPRLAQVTALSAREMEAAIDHAHAGGQDSFTVVSHSFELLARDRMRANPLVARRFARLCRHIERRGLATGTYADSPPRVPTTARVEAHRPLPHNPIRTAMRMGEQLIVNQLYGDR